jgi:hypothetical protein
MDPSSTAKAAAPPNNADHVLLIPPDHQPPPPHPSNNQHPNPPPAETPKLSQQNPEKHPTSSPSRPPLPPAALLRRRSSIAKPKSRFVEPPTPTHPDSAHTSPVHPAAAAAAGANASLTATPTHRAAAGVSTPHTPAEADEDEDLFRNKDGSRAPASAARCRRRARLGLELCVLVLFLGLLVVSLVVPHLQGRVLWGLEIWKWCVMVIAVFSGHLLSQWLVTVIVFVVERNFLLRTKVLYFVFGLKKSFQVCLWLALVLIAWSQLFDSDVGRSRKTARILNYVSRFLASMLIGSVIWLVKTFLMKLVASTFHRKTFFDRIQESVFHQYVLQTLSGPPLMELAENVGREGSGLGRVSIGRAKDKEEKGVPEVIDVGKLRRMSQEKVSAWTMRGLITAIRSSRLSTISNTIESFDDVDGMEQKDKEINSEWEAKVAAYAIFKNVARPGYK